VKKLWLLVEWGLLFILAPVLVGQIFHRSPWVIILIVITIGAAVWLRRRGDFSVSSFWRSQDEGEEQRQLKRVLRRFLLCASVLVMATMALFPEKLFAFPRAMPIQWALLLATYPVLSVYPQELLYRAFFLKRYAGLFPNGRGLWFGSALAFAWLHVIFRNPLAIALTLVGGWFFAQTYGRTQSMRLVCLEHTLYGSLIFSVGLGEFFLQNALFQ
jgi:CAAX protease family protein